MKARAFFTLLAISLFTHLSLCAQTYAWLKPKLASADTIVLASHEDFRSTVDTAGNGVPVPSWVISGHPDYIGL